MDEKKMTLLVAGVYLGDISLALAAVAEEPPSYVDGLDFNQLLVDVGESGDIRRKVEEGLGERAEPGQLPQSLIREILDAAIARGKFL